MATGLNTAAIVGTGPLAKRLGEEYQLHGYRTANLLICSGGTLNYLMPYMVPVVCAAMMTAVDLPGAVPSPHWRSSPTSSIPFFCWL